VIFSGCELVTAAFLGMRSALLDVSTRSKRQAILPFVVFAAFSCGCVGSSPTDIKKWTVRYLLPVVTINAPRSVHVNEVFDINFGYIGEDCAPIFSWGGIDSDKRSQDFYIFASDYTQKNSAMECKQPGVFFESISLPATGTWLIQYDPSQVSGLSFPPGSIKTISIEVLPALKSN
jgi:hypothetical protein